MAIDNFLSRLEGLRKTGEGKWRSRCPAHGSKSQTLAIKEAEDGRVLVKCFAGCGAVEIIQAVGLRMHDLMPECVGEHKRERNPFPASERLACIEADATIVFLAASHIARKGKLTEEQKDRLLAAVVNIKNAQDMAYRK